MVPFQLGKLNRNTLGSITGPIPGSHKVGLAFEKGFRTIPVMLVYFQTKVIHNGWDSLSPEWLNHRYEAGARGCNASVGLNTVSNTAVYQAVLGLHGRVRFYTLVPESFPRLHGRIDQIRPCKWTYTPVFMSKTEKLQVCVWGLFGSMFINEKVSNDKVYS